MHRRQDVHLVQAGVSGPQMDAAVLQAAESDQWDVVLDALHLEVSPAVRDAVFLKIAECGQWDFVLDAGFIRAAKQKRWDCACKLLDLGVSPAIRDRVFPGVVDSDDAQLSSYLITAGLTPALQDQVLRRAVELGRVSFVVDLLRLTAKASLNAFVLDTAVTLHHWTLLSDLVQMHEELHLSAEQIDAACRAAVYGLQCNSALLLAERGVRPNQEMLDTVLRSGSFVLEHFLGIFPRESMPSAVKQMLIKDAIAFNEFDTLRKLLHRLGASDTDTKEAFDSAVSCRDGGTLRALVSCAKRNSQLLKQFCVTKSHVYLPGHFVWICEALKDRHIELSLDIALATNSQDFLENLVFCDKTSRKVRRRVLQKVCANNEELFEEIAEKLVARYPGYRRSLFLMSVRQGCESLSWKLLGQGVTPSDVIYAYSVAEVCWDGKDISVLDYTKRLNKEDGSKVFKGLVRTRLKYFVSKGEEETEFLTMFEEYCGWKEAETKFVFSVFRRAYKAAVHWENEECFVESINRVMDYSRKGRRPVVDTLYEIGTPADDNRVSGKYTSIVNSAIDFSLKKQKFDFVSQIIMKDEFDELIPRVLKRVFRKGAWPVFDKVLETEYPCCARSVQVFIHCLFRTVVGTEKTIAAEASVAVTVRVSDTVTEGALSVLDKWLYCMCAPSRAFYSQGCVLRKALGSHAKLREHSAAVMRLVELSSRHSCHGLALFLTTVLGADGIELMRRVVASRPDYVDFLVLELAFYAAKTLTSYTAAAVIIKNCPLSTLTHNHRHTLLLIAETNSQEMITALRREHAYRWVLVFQLNAEDFAEAEQTLTLCKSSQECVDVVVDYAARSSRSDIFHRYVSEACRPNLLHSLLSEELNGRLDGDAGIVRCLLNLVGTSHGVRQTHSYLSDVCRRLYNRQQVVVSLARCLVSMGASAQHRSREGADGSHNCPLRTASVYRKLQLVQLFHRSGVCTNRRLFQLADASRGNGFRDTMYYNTGSDDADKTIIQSYLTFAAQVPLSLRDLCRHTVTSCLGGRPGYLQRVETLPVPEVVHNFILFSDVT